jgi:HlyD family secretion protein
MTELIPSRAIVSDGSDDPSRDIRSGQLILGGFVGLLLLWAAITPLDAAATASGQITVSGHNQIVQHREGGVVAALDVIEGQAVKAGQVLVELAPEDVGAQVRALRAQQISLQAQQARLLAEVENKPSVAWPAAFATLSGDDLVAAREAIKSQDAQFTSGLTALNAQEATLSRKAAGLRQQIEGGQGQLASLARQQVLLDQQLQGVRALAAKGFASQNSVRVLERNEADLGGARALQAANVGDYGQQVAQAGLQSRDLRAQRSLTASASLRETEDQLNEITPKLAAAQAELERGTLRAQADGQVKGLAVFAPGAVVSPGQKLMEIVPTRRALVVDARLRASDVEGVRPGRPADVRLLSDGARQAPVLKGTVSQLSADSFTDEHTGQSYFTVEVTVPQSQLLALSQGTDMDTGIHPGAPASVAIPLRKRSALGYLLEPFSQALWQSFRQR